MQSSPTDNELLARYVRESAEAAFAELVRRYLNLVFSAALRQTRDPAMAEETVQKVFITLARRAPVLLGYESLAGWLYRTALLQARESRRAEDRRRRREQLAVELGTTMKTEESSLVELAPVLDEAMEELRPADREAILLRFFAGKSWREVGDALGVHEDAARKRVSKAVDALTTRFQRRGFRVAGAAMTMMALQKASASVPAGLAASTTKIALAAGAGSFGKWTIPLAKLMSISKLQTTVLCVAAALAPLGYQWHSINATRAVNDALVKKASALQQQLAGREQERLAARATLAELQSRLRESPDPAPTPAVQGIAAAPNLYTWEEASAYVRLPKSLLGAVKVGAFESRASRDGKLERAQTPLLAADGTPQPALAAALGLNSQEADQLTGLCRNAVAQFQDLAAKHSTLNEETMPDGVKEVLRTAAFAAEGSALQTQFHQALSDLLGPEKTEVFFQQASKVFSDYLNDFGAYPRELDLINRQNQPLTLMESYQGTSRIGALAGLGPKLLPPQIQQFVNIWSPAAPSSSEAGQPVQQ